MKLLTKHTISTILLAALSLTSTAIMADDDDKKYPTCTDAAIAASEAYDPGTADKLNCIAERDDFKVVVAWNSSAFNGKIFKTTGQHVGQQVVNVRNLSRDYLNNYNMVHGNQYETVIVAYASGVDWLRTTTDQANQDMINSLMALGMKIYACQNTMKSKGLLLGDLLPGIEIVPAGVSAIIDFENRRYQYINP